MEKENYTVLRTKLLEVYHELQITNEEILFMIHLLSFQQQQDDFPSIQLLQSRMAYSDEQMYDLIGSLMERGFLKIENMKNSQGQTNEQYNLSPLYTKIERLADQQVQKMEEEQTDHDEGGIFDVIETEFGRQLSPIEYQQVSSWFTKDKYEVDMVKEAIKEAVLNQVYSLKYIDRILINWRKQNKQSNNHQSRNNTKQMTVNKNTLPPVPLKKFLKR